MRIRQFLPQRLRQALARLSQQPEGPSTRRRRTTRLGCEELEPRTLLTANLTPIQDFEAPTGKTLLVPLSVVTPPASGSTVTYTVQSNNAAVTAQLVTGGRSLRMNVSGRDSAGNPFTGDLTIRLFEDLSPLATARIISLANSGFYNGLTFHRIVDGFVAQGGDPEGDGTGGSQLGDFADEYNVGLTFNSPGLFAMANSGDD